MKYFDSLLDHLREAEELLIHKREQVDKKLASYGDLEYAAGRVDGLKKAVRLYDSSC